MAKADEDNKNPTPPSNDNNPPEWVDELKSGFESVKTDIETINQKIEDLETTIPGQPPVEEGKPPSWQPKTWDDIPIKAEEIVAAKLAERDEQARQAEQAQQATQAEIDKGYDNQEAQLEKAGALPEVKNSADSNDPGRAARRELYGLALSLNSDDLLAVGAELKRNHDLGYHYDVTNRAWIRANTQFAGTQAPVGSSNQSGAAIEPGKPGWKEIREARDLHSLAEVAKRATGSDA